MQEPAPGVSRSSVSAAALGVVALVGLIGQSACAKLTEIVLTIDTDLGVTAELDQVQISISPTESASPISVDLTATGAPSFPLTLGLTPGGALSPVSIQVAGFQAGAPVVERDLQTAFVQDRSSLVSILLTLSCRDIACPSQQTCNLGMCIPILQQGGSFPTWSGVVPSRLSAEATSIGGRSVWSNGWHSCATKGSSFSCWGRNLDGELGCGNNLFKLTRREVSNLPPPSSVGLGEYHSCTCDQTGQAWCWGSNSDGQVGAGNASDRLVPTAVTGLTDCVQITGGGYHTCALRNGGVVSCWGRNTSGQCGLPATTASVSTPTRVPGVSAVVDVRAGEAYTCARQTNNDVICWGDNSEGQLGDGTLTSRENPERVMNLTQPVELAAGRTFACVRISTGNVHCWGNNPAGGIGTAADPAMTPVAIPGIADAIQLAVGHEHACVLHLTGAVSCWGDDQYNQLGDSSQLSTATPRNVMAIPNDATSISAGDQHSCARRSNGALMCWGQNVLDQLGDGSGDVPVLPVEVVGF
jgi:alpha-tubulin suppressor-like RCC1 family protein